VVRIETLQRGSEEVNHKDIMKAGGTEIMSPRDAVYRLLTAVGENPVYTILVS
jgi:hypothetical protein